jgi:DNA adenine methylase
MNNIKHSPILPEMRQAFSGLGMDSLPITYTIGGGKKVCKAAELVIRNW